MGRIVGWDSIAAEIYGRTRLHGGRIRRQLPAPDQVRYRPSDRADLERLGGARSNKRGTVLSRLRPGGEQAGP